MRLRRRSTRWYFSERETVYKTVYLTENFKIETTAIFVDVDLDITDDLDIYICKRKKNNKVAVKEEEGNNMDK